jgi:hypothetical protein
MDLEVPALKDHITPTLKSLSSAQNSSATHIALIPYIDMEVAFLKMNSHNSSQLLRV